MKKNLLLSLAVSVFAFTSALADGEKDITATYLKNASFEQDDITKLSAVNNSADGLRGYTVTSPAEWTVSGTSVTSLIVNKDCFTDNNFGKVTTLADGAQAYYLRQGWSTGNTSVSQKVNLPKGKYRLSLDWRAAYANSATSSFNLKAGGESTSGSFSQGSQSIFTSMAWNTTNTDFEVEADGSVSLSIDITWLSGGSCIIMDNIRLWDMTNYKEPEEPTEDDVTSPTEGVINNEFVPESEMKTDLLKMLANFSTFMNNQWFQCQAPNSVNESCGYFKGENSGGNNEQGVRHNADMSMICAFLVKYAKPQGITLPAGITWEKVEEMAMKSLIFAYSTHKANKLKVCSGGNYWGSLSTSDAVWESSLWAMSVAYSAYFQWDKLSEAQKNYIYKMLKAECNYELYRSIPTGYAGDTKAEENGWEADILAVTLGLFPNDELAPKWFERLREFAINSYSHPSDAANSNIIDDWYDNKTVADLYKGQNLYDDWSLQNHNLFHTSYQNVVMQELGEAALGLKMFQQGLYGTEKWKTNALMHNNQQVMDNIMNWLALADGELAMPNGNDWSLFLYDQITSYTTQACFQRDANALMLENLAYKQIKARQQTTTDGSWLLRSDVGSRRMGVEAHRVMMTYLMHEVLSTAELTPTSWEDFRNSHGEAMILPCQNVVRAYTPSKFSTFSWSTGLKSYTGYFAPDSPDKNKIIVPFRANSTGNIVGWYEVSGKATDATPVVSGVYQLKGNSYVMNGEMNTNGGTLNKRFAVYSTPGNSYIYIDYITANSAATITADKTGLLAISTDELTKLKRTLYYGDKEGELAHKQLDGTVFTTISSDWVNIDNEVSIINLKGGRKVAFGERSNNNSIMTAKLYPAYNPNSRSVKSGDVVDNHILIYNVESATKTQKNIEQGACVQIEGLPEGWVGVRVIDNSNKYFILSNFKGTENKATVKDCLVESGLAPVFLVPTTIKDGKSTATFEVAQNNSYAQALPIALCSWNSQTGANLMAQGIDETSFYAWSETSQEIFVSIMIGDEAYKEATFEIKAGKTYRIYLDGENILIDETEIPEIEPGANMTGKIVNPSFEGNTAAGWSGTTPGFQSYTNAEFFNKTFDIYQNIEGLEEGYYEVGVQAFYRCGGYNDAATKYKNGTEKLNAVLYANDAQTEVASIFKDANNNYRVGVSTTAGYVPDNMEQAASYFRQQLYNNKVIAQVGPDGKLKIGLKKTTTVSNDWTIFDNFTLKYLGKNDPTGIQHLQTAISAPEGIFRLDGSKVSNSKALTPGIYVVDGKKVIVK